MIYNTVSSVVANIEAPSKAEAERKLATALNRAGFEVYDAGESTVTLGAIEAEDGTEPDELPGRGASRPGEWSW